MAILHTFIKEKDVYYLTAGQDLEYSLEYINKNKTTLITTKVLALDAISTLPISIDGNYRLTVVADGEEDIIINFHVKYNLRNSIIVDLYHLLCGNCNCTNNTATCISKLAKKCLKHKAIFTKLMTYQHYYIPLYENNYITRFANFIALMLPIVSCNVQSMVNNILKEECITGSVKDVDKFFKLYLTLYWLGMYYIERLEAGTDQDELEYIDTVYRYETISQCVCGLGFGIDMEEVEDVFNDATGGTPIVYHWQFPDTDTDISFAPTINLAYLITKDSMLIETFEAGQTFTYNGIGRIAFAIANVSENAYKIEDTFGEDVTSVVFDTYYNASSSTQIYISKEYYVNPSIYYQLIKL